MKIIITESQHRRIVKEETKQMELANKVKQGLSSADLKTTMYEITTLYSYSEEEIINNSVLMELVKEKMLKEIKDNYYISKDLRDKYGNYFGLVGQSAAKEIVQGGSNPYSKFLQLDAVLKTIPRGYSITESSIEIVKEMRDGLTYDAIQYLFDNFEVAGAIKRASIMKDRSGNYDEIYPYVKEWAIKHGITLFEKHRGLTFIKKDGMMQSLVNYLKDVNPKTKSGFLDYINSRGRSTGQHAYFWKAAQESGIITPVRNGRQITYQLGPNYEAWKNDNLVAF
jgi:hypothetical protein